VTRIVTNKAVMTDYDDLAPVYDRHWAGFNRAVRTWVTDRFPHGLPPGARVLDAGCGTGHMLAAIAAEMPNLQLTGMDISPGMLGRARAAVPGAAISEGDIEHMAPPGGAYDVVLSLNVLHHLNEPARHLQALAAACAPGGTVFLCDFAVESLSMRLAERHWRRFKPSHHAAFSVAEMNEMLRPLPLAVADRDILCPDIFWRLQIYRLARAQAPS
jgi:ubiquinone/menaquinone biosynthesis C-methylase UbiE